MTRAATLEAPRDRLGRALESARAPDEARRVLLEWDASVFTRATRALLATDPAQLPMRLAWYNHEVSCSYSFLVDYLSSLTGVSSDDLWSLAARTDTIARGGPSTERTLDVLGRDHRAAIDLIEGDHEFAIVSAAAEGLTEGSQRELHEAAFGFMALERFVQDTALGSLERARDRATLCRRKVLRAWSELRRDATAEPTDGPVTPLREDDGDDPEFVLDIE